VRNGWGYEVGRRDLGSGVAGLRHGIVLTAAGPLRRADRLADDRQPDSPPPGSRVPTSWPVIRRCWPNSSP